MKEKILNGLLMVALVAFILFVAVEILLGFTNKVLMMLVLLKNI